MPEMRYRLRWPDDSESLCWSPSLVIKDFFVPGSRYPLADFLRRAREATHIASERVRAKYGFACSAAQDQLQVLEARAHAFAERPGAQVELVDFLE